MAHSSFLERLSGQEYGRLWAWGNKPKQKGAYEIASPCRMSDLPQSHLEPILVEEATKLGAEFCFSTEFVSVAQDDTGVSTVLRYRNTQETYTVRSSYLIGGDGARSGVVSALGIPISGRQINTAFNVHIQADLTKYIAHRPGSLNWVLNTEAPDWSAVGNFRMVRPWTEWVVSMHPAVKDGERFAPTEEDVIKRLHQIMVTIQCQSSCFRYSNGQSMTRSPIIGKKTAFYALEMRFIAILLLMAWEVILACPMHSISPGRSRMF